MGSSASKTARSATQAAQAAQAASRRQYPKQPSKPSPATQRPSPPPSRPSQASQAPGLSPASREPKVGSRMPPQGPTYHSKEQASAEKSSAIDLDGRDPHFAASLRSIGPVTPSPTFSPSSTFNQSQSQSQPSPSSQTQQPSIFPSPSMNPALFVLTARQRIAHEAESETEELGRGSFAGRRYVDAFTIRQMLAMRDRQGLEGGEIERLLRLREGVVGRAGRGGKEGVFGVP